MQKIHLQIFSGEQNIANYTPQIEIDKKHTHFFTLFAKNTAALFLLVVKMAALLFYMCLNYELKILNDSRSHQLYTLS